MLGQLQARLRAERSDPPLSSSIYRSYFGNFLSELKAHSWDSVSLSSWEAGNQLEAAGASWSLEPPAWGPEAAERSLEAGHL